MPITRVADIADKIAERRRIHREMLRAEMRVLEKDHGAGPVKDALALLAEQNRPSASSAIDHEGRKLEVTKAIDRVVAEREQYRRDRQVRVTYLEPGE